MTAEKHVDGWKVRVVVHNAILHFVSSTEPQILTDPPGTSMRDVVGLDWTPTGEGDTPGYIDWSAVSAITWRAPAK